VANNCPYWRENKCAGTNSDYHHYCSFDKVEYESCAVYKMIKIKSAGGTMGDMLKGADLVCEAEVVGGKGRRFSDEELKEIVNESHSAFANKEETTASDRLEGAAAEGWLVISKEMILDLDLSRLEREVDDIVSRFKEENIETIHINVSGYENDDRALFTIPEVRRWCTEAAKRSRALPFLDEETLGWFIPAIAPIEIVDSSDRSTGFRWNAREFLRRFYVVVFIATARVGLDSHSLTALAGQATQRFQAIAGRFGTTFELDDELKHEITLVVKSLKMKG